MPGPASRFGVAALALLVGGGAGYVLSRPLFATPSTTPTPPPATEVQLTTDPPGAYLSLDGEPLGKSPLVVRLAPLVAEAEYKLVASLPGYQAAQHTLRSGHQSPLHLSLSPAAP